MTGVSENNPPVTDSCAGDIPAISYSLDWPFAYGEPQITADFRTQAEDFWVDEILGFDLAGEGEHLCLHIEKRGENTAWVAKELAKLCGVKQMDVGYAGRKDRHAVTRQWFSIYLPEAKLAGRNLDWSALQSEDTDTYIKILAQTRHNQKLRPGVLKGNRFKITLRNLSEPISEQRLSEIKEQGVPNYFGEQRFGREGNNLREVERLFQGKFRLRDKKKRGLLFSSARSYLFNQVLAARVAQKNWLNVLEGEPEALPTAPLWGRGRLASSGPLADLEASVLENFRCFRDGLEHSGMSQERRACQLIPKNFHWQQDDGLVVEFELESGAFATSLLREICQLNNLSLAARGARSSEKL